MMARRSLLSALLALAGCGRPASGAVSGSTQAATLLARMDAMALPCISLRAGEKPSIGKIGGRPDMAGGVDWPRWKDAPLAFLGQLDLTGLRLAGGPGWLPEKGALFFFYDAEQSTWGFDPADLGSWRVIHDPAGFADAPRDPPAGLPAHGVYRERSLGGRIARSWPDAELVDLPVPDVDGPDWAAYEKRLNAAVPDDGLAHQVGGHPGAIQSSGMALECQLASNGVDVGGPEGYQSPRRKELEPGAKDWRLLLQLDSDDDAGMMWGDVGRLYFWVREAAARRGDFAGAWMILQSS